MGGDRPAVQDSQIVQPFDHSLSVFPPALLYICSRLRGMDMESGAQLPGTLRAAPHRRIAHGKGRMQSEESSQQRALRSPAMAEELSILLNTLLGDLPALAVGHLVAETTPHTRLLRSLRDAEETPPHRAGAGMMVTDRGCPVADAVDHSHA